MVCVLNLESNAYGNTERNSLCCYLDVTQIYILKPFSTLFDLIADNMFFKQTAVSF